MKKLLFLLGGSALLLLCILFGAFFAGPMLASANSQHTAVATPNAKSQMCDLFQQSLAKRLGISVSTLQQDRQGALGDVLAQAVKDGKLTQAQADKIKQQAQNRPGCDRAVRHNFASPLPMQLLKKYQSDLVTPIAQALKLSPDQLKSQLQSGKSLNEIAQAQHVSVSDLQAVAIKTFNNVLDKAVSAKDITQAQADQARQFVQNHPQLLNKIFSSHMGMHAGMHKI